MTIKSTRLGRTLQRKRRTNRGATLALLAVALVACGDDDDQATSETTAISSVSPAPVPAPTRTNETSATSSAATDGTAAASEPSGPATTGADAEAGSDGTATPAPASGSLPPCPLGHDEVSQAVGASLQPSPELADSFLVDPIVRQATDALCAFTADGSPTSLPLVIVQSSDDARSEEVITAAMTSGNVEVGPIDGLGDRALGNGEGELAFVMGSTWTLVLAAVSNDDAANAAAAEAVARLLTG